MMRNSVVIRAKTCRVEVIQSGRSVSISGFYVLHVVLQSIPTQAKRRSSCVEDDCRYRGQGLVFAFFASLLIGRFSAETVVDGSLWRGRGS